MFCTFRLGSHQSQLSHLSEYATVFEGMVPGSATVEVAAKVTVVVQYKQMGGTAGSGSDLRYGCIVS